MILSLLLCSATAATQTVQTDLDSDLQQGLKSFGTTHGSEQVIEMFEVARRTRIRSHSSITDPAEQK